MRPAALALLALTLVASAVPGQDSAGQLPRELQGVKFEPLLKEQIPLDVAFRDERNQPITLASYCDGRKLPVVLALVQYRCPNLCGQVLEGLLGGMRDVAKRGLRLGQHYRVVILSFDPTEDAELAAAKKASFLEAYGLGGGETCHFLTGNRAAIARVAEKAGFEFRWDERTKQYAHGSGILLLTPQGRISQFLPGIEYRDTTQRERDLYYGLVEASKFQIGKPIADRLVLLFCYGYDPKKGTYQFAIMNVVRIAGILTVLGVVALIVVLRRKERQNLQGAGGLPC